MRRFTWFILILLLAKTIPGTCQGTRADKSGNSITLTIVLGAECPISQNYMFKLNEIYSTYESSIKMVGVFPPSTKKKAISAYRKTYTARFPLTRDDNGMILSELGATVTPEVFLKDASGSIVYKGAIDNWYFELGRNRKEVTEDYLVDAIKAILDGKEPPVKTAKAIGCLLQPMSHEDKEHMMHDHN